MKMLTDRPREHSEITSQSFLRSLTRACKEQLRVIKRRPTSGAVDELFDLVCAIADEVKQIEENGNARVTVLLEQAGCPVWTR